MRAARALAVAVLTTGVVLPGAAAQEAKMMAEAAISQPLSITRRLRPMRSDRMPA